MNHRIVSAVTAFVLALFGGAALFFALGMTPERPPLATPDRHDVPHASTGAFAPCRDCHVRGAAGPEMPRTHREFGAGQCLTCHRPRT